MTDDREPAAPTLPPAAQLVTTPGAELWAQARLSAPLAAQQAGQQLMSSVDTAILGHFSAQALAGSGVAAGMQFAITCVGLGIVMGLDAVLPRAVGAGDRTAVDRALFAGLRMAVLVSIPSTLAVVCAPWLLPFFGTEPAVAAEAQRYLWGRAPGVLPFLLTAALRPYLVAHGTTWPIVVAMVGGNLLNVGADLVFVFGDRALRAAGLPELGLPALGTLGAALATSLVQLASLAIYARAALTLRRALLGPAAPRPARGPELARIAHHGVPIGLQLLAEISVFATAAVLSAHFGASAAGAHSVAISLASFSFASALGIGAATATRVGLATGSGGAEGHRLARRRGLVGLGLGMAVMTAAALAFWLVPRPLIGVYTDAPEVLAMAVPLLGVAAVFQLFDGAQAVMAGAMRGVGRTRQSLVANVIGHYVVGLPISLALGFGAGMGVVGIWWGLSAGLIVTSLILIVRFLLVTAHPRGA